MGGGGFGYMNNPKGALDRLEPVVRDQTDIESTPVILWYDPYRSTQGNAYYAGEIRGRAAGLVRQAVVPGSGGRYQRIQYSSVNAYCILRGAFDVANIPENVSGLGLDTFGASSALLLTSGASTGTADPRDIAVAPQQYFFPPAGTAPVRQFSFDVRGTDAAGGKIADEAIAAIRFSLDARVEEGFTPPPRITFPDFSATLTVTISSPSHL